MTMRPGSYVVNYDDDYHVGRFSLSSYVESQYVPAPPGLSIKDCDSDCRIRSTRVEERATASKFQTAQAAPGGR